MLSIGKLVAGAEDYYLGMVAGGREEYYTGSGEAPGMWVGSGITDLGLAGTVEPEALRALLAGISPQDGTTLGAPRHDGRRVAGFDLTFSAPKSVSLLYGLGDPEVSAAARGAHDAAVAEALTYLERHATVARRGAGGQTRMETSGLVGAAFVHRTSRAGDPQLHTHVLAANAVLGADGRWSAPDARLLYFHGRTAGYLYQASLRAGLVESLGVRFGPVTNGAAEVAGLDPVVLRGFSTRRSEIVEYLFARGLSSRRSAEVAALATRAPKGEVALAGDLRLRWRERAADLGADLAHLFERGRPRAVRVGEGAGAVIRAELLGSEGLTAHDSVFERRDVVRAVAERLAEGGRLADIEAVSDRVLAQDEVVALPTLGRGGESLATTRDLLGIEAALLERAGTARDTGPRLGAARVAAALEEHSRLSGEQRAMVERLATSGAGVEIVVGKAGAGKTTSLALARQLFEDAGYEVAGTALSARATAELKSSAGIDSVTLARFLGELESGARRLSSRHVVVVDEAGMVGTRTLAKVVDLTERAGSKLVLVGDPAQLPEIEAGGAFGALACRLDAIELTENRRQRALWERLALDQLRRGDAVGALDVYVAHERVEVVEKMADARAAMVAAWFEARDGTGAGLTDHGSSDQALMLAVSRADVEALNGMARAARRARGELGDDVVEAAERGFAVGDEVLARRNARRLGVMNGTRGTVLAWDGHHLEVETDTGVVTLPRHYLEAGHLHHGYACTVHLAQGLTCARVFVLATEALGREAGYVALSRARDSARLFVVAGSFEDGHGPEQAPTEPLALVATRLSRSRAKQLAHEHLGEGASPSAERANVPELGFNGATSGEGRPVRTFTDLWVTDFSGPEAPAHVVAALGARPAFVDEQPRYDDLAAAISEYRVRYDVEGDEPLGARPHEPGPRLSYDALAARIRGYDRYRGRELDMPNRDVGLER